MKKLIVGLSVLVATGSIISCGNKATGEFPGYKKVEKGLFVKYLAENKGGRVIKQGDIVTLSMSYKTSTDSVLFESSTTGQPVQLRADTGQYEGDVIGAFIGMKEGDSASLMVDAESFFLNTARMPELPDYIDSASYLTFTVGLQKVESLEELQAAQAAKDAERSVAETADLQKYLADNGIEATPSESGLIYISKTKGTGKQATAGKTVKVNYEGRLLDGTYFDTSVEEVAKAQGIHNPQRPYNPFEFTLGQGQVIQGWDEGIALMKEGEKATLIIPSKIAYGANPRPGGVIKPYSTLIFEVELIEVRD